MSERWPERWMARLWLDDGSSVEREWNPNHQATFVSPPGRLIVGLEPFSRDPRILLEE